MGATNRPFDLDEAALRRMAKRIYIGLPDLASREAQITKLISSVKTNIGKADMLTIA